MKFAAETEFYLECTSCASSSFPQILNKIGDVGKETARTATGPVAERPKFAYALEEAVDCPDVSG